MPGELCAAATPGTRVVRLSPAKHPQLPCNLCQLARFVYAEKCMSRACGRSFVFAIGRLRSGRKPIGLQIGDALACLGQCGCCTCDGLPTLNDHIDASRVQLDLEADATGRLRREWRRAGCHEGFKDGLTRGGVVQDRAAHALDRFLGAVHGGGILIPAGNLPEGGLLAVPRPMALVGLLYRMPTGLMLSVKIPTAQHQSVLRPDELRPDGESSRYQAFRHGVRM